MPDNNPVENLFMSFCKQLLGVQKQTTNLGVLLELGQVPLVTLACGNAIKNWVRIVNNIKCNDNVVSSYNASVLENLSWSTNIRLKLEEMGMGDLFIGGNGDSHLKAFQRMVDIFHQGAFSSVGRDDSKLRTYGLLKLAPGYETYLTDIKCIKERTALTKLRLSNHMLMIEKGRHQKLDRGCRFCPFCPGAVEDELHFLLDCGAYGCLRREFLGGAGKIINSLSYMGGVQKFCALINGALLVTSRFVYRASEVREFMLRRHKGWD